MRLAVSAILAIAVLPWTVQAQQDTTIRASSTLMEVEVQVLDKRGRPVEGLTAADFQLTENGDPQDIRAFEYIDVPRETAAARVASAAPPPAEAPSSPASGEAAGAGSEPLRIFISTQVSENERVRTRQAIRKFVEKEMPAGALVSINGAPFLNDPELLLKLLDNDPMMDPLTGNPLNDQRFQLVLEPPPEENLSNDDLLAGRRFRSDFDSTDELFSQFGREQLRRYVEMIRALRMYPGKKMIVLFARGFPLGFDAAKQVFLNLDDPYMLERLRAESVRARISLYVVDARGLEVGSTGSAENSDGQRTEMIYSKRQADEGVPGFLAARSPVTGGLDDSFRQRQQGLQVIAEQTGGVAVLNTNNLGEIFDKVKADLGGYYLLGYYLPERTNSKQARKIRVEIPAVDAKLRYRSEFYDDAEFTAMLEQEYRDRLSQALGPAPDPSSLDAPVAALEAYRSAHDQLGSPAPTLAVALADLERAVELYPPFAAAWNLLGYVRERLTDPAGATAAYQSAADASPDYVRPRAHLARLALGRQDWPAALDHAQAVLDAEPENAEVAYYRAVAHYGAGNLELASVAASQAVEAGAAKTFPKILQLQGLLQAGKGDFAAAANSYQRYLSDNPNAVDAKLVEQQLHYWQTAPELLALREAVESDDWAEASERSQNLLAVDPELEEARYYAAVSAYRMGEFEHAVELGEALLVSADGQAYPQLHRMLGAVYADQGQLDKAAQRYRSYLTLEPQAEDAKKLQRQLADWEKARRFDNTDGPRLRIVNRFGDLTIRSLPHEPLAMQASSPARELRAGDVVAVQEGPVTTIESRPTDSAHIDLEITVPYGQTIEAETEDGAVALDGLFYSVQVRTRNGAIQLAAPWRATALDIDADQAPTDIALPSSDLFQIGAGPREWRLTAAHSPLIKTYGRIAVDSEMPSRIAISDQPIPQSSPIKLPWQAPEVIDTVLSGGSSPALTADGASTPANEPSGATFSADVRLVSMSVAVMGADGSAVLDLQPADFQVLEDGRPQQIESISAGTAPINLALLLDFSGSTIDDRASIKLAARRLIATARPIDRVAIYTLGDEMFAVASQLTSEYARLVDALEAIPPLTGGSPLYDAVALAWAQELRQKAGERNALVVLTDGVDNRLAVEYYQRPRATKKSRKPAPARKAPPGVAAAQSNLTFEQLLAGVARMDSLLYPFVLRRSNEGRLFPGDVEDRAREQMEQLAATSGARVIRAESIDDTTAFHDLMRDLRSVYTISYRPRNPTLDGEWRTVEVRSDNPALKIRTRPGYFAR